MNSAILLAAVMTGATARAADMSKPPAVGPMRSVKLPPRFEWRLKNGLTVVLVADRRVPLVTAVLAAPGGAGALPAEDAGLAEATAELLTEGTAGKTAKQVSDAAELYGGRIAASSTPDAMLVETSALADKAGEMLALLAEVARSPSFPEAEVALRKANMASELQASRAESDFLSAVAFHKKLFAGHPYAVTAPTDASIARLDRARVVAAYARLFGPAGATLVLVGDIAAERARGLVEKNFGDWAGAAPPAAVPPPSAAKPERTVFLLDRPKSAQVSFVLGNLAAREDDPAYFDLLVANGVLGGSFSSRLVRDVRETKGYTYRISSRLAHRLAASVFRIATPVRTEVAGPALKAVLDHVEALREKGPTQGELVQAKAYLAGSFARSLETQEGLAGAVLHQKLMRLPEGFYDSYVERIQAVTAESAKRAARAFMRPGGMTVVAVGDASRSARVLAEFSKGPIIPVNVDGD